MGIGDKDLVSWTDAAGLANGPYMLAATLQMQLLIRVTSEGCTWIDHILHTDRHNNIHCTGAHTVQGSAWLTISDHSPIWADYLLPSGHDPTTTSRMKAAHREYIELPFTDKEKGKRFEEDMNTCWVTKRIAKGLHKSLRSSYKTGWNPNLSHIRVI